MKCKNCGTILDAGSKFCGNCGSKVDEVSSVSPMNSSDSSREGVNVSNQNTDYSINSSSNNVVDNVSGVGSTNISNSSGKSRNFVLPIVLLLLVVCAVGGLFFYFKNPKRIITSVINGGYDKLEGLLVESDSFDYEKDSILVKGDLKFDTNIPELSDLKSENFSYSVGLDYPNKKMSMGVSLYEGNSRLIDAMVYFLNNEGYISLGDDFSSLIKMDSEDTDFSEIFNIEKSNVSVSDIKYIVKSYKDIFIDSLDMSDFDKSSAKITLNGKEVSVDKLTYTFDDNNTKKLYENIIDNTLSDSKLLETLARVGNTSVDDIKSDLESSRNDSISGNENFVVSIYTKGLTNSLVGLDVKVSEGEDIRIRFNDSTTDIDLYSVNVKVVGVQVKNIDDDNCVIDFSAEALNLSGSISIYSKQIDKKNSEGSVKVSVNYNGSSFSLTNSYTCSIGDGIANIDTSSARSFDELSEQEMNSLSDLYTSRFENSKIYGLFDELSSMFSQSSNYDYDYDYYDIDDFDFNSL